MVGGVLYLPLSGIAFLILKLAFNIQDNIEIRRKEKDVEIKNARERSVFEENRTKGEAIEAQFSKIVSSFGAKKC